MKAAALLNGFFALFYPRLCSACGETLISGEQCICTFCLHHLPLTNLHKSEENKISQMFWGRVSIETGTALFYYQKGCKVQHLIHQFKYKGKTDIGIFLGNVLGKQLNESGLYRGIDMIIPVPLHPRRQHKRGFNQSEIFAEGLCQVMKVPLVTNVLLRITATSTQTRKSKFLRWENVESVFHVAIPKLLENKNVLLVDDVITTGATMEACVQMLNTVPGVKVWVASIAYANL